MIGLYLSIGHQRSKRFEIAKDRVTIGSDANNDLVLRDGGVAPFHGALVRVRDRWFLSVREPDVFSSNRMRALQDGARIQVGEYTIVLAAAPPPIGPPRVRAAGTPAEPLPVRRAAGTPVDSAVVTARAKPRAGSEAQAPDPELESARARDREEL